jgi:hypothetical protein
MLYRENIAVCSEIHTKHMRALCGQNVQFLNVKPDGTQRNHWALTGLIARKGKAVSLFYELHVMEAMVQPYSFLASALFTTKAPASLRPRQQDAVMHRIGRWVVPRARLGTQAERQL